MILRLRKGTINLNPYEKQMVDYPKLEQRRVMLRRIPCLAGRQAREIPGG